MGKMKRRLLCADKYAQRIAMHYVVESIVAVEKNVEEQIESVWLEDDWCKGWDDVAVRIRSGDQVVYRRIQVKCNQPDSHMEGKELVQMIWEYFETIRELFEKTNNKKHRFELCIAVQDMCNVRFEKTGNQRKGRMLNLRGLSGLTEKVRGAPNNLEKLLKIIRDAKSGGDIEWFDALLQGGPALKIEGKLNASANDMELLTRLGRIEVKVFGSIEQIKQNALSKLAEYYADLEATWALLENDLLPRDATEYDYQHYRHLLRNQLRAATARQWIRLGLSSPQPAANLRVASSARLEDSIKASWSQAKTDRSPSLQIYFGPHWADTPLLRATCRLAIHGDSGLEVLVSEHSEFMCKLERVFGDTVGHEKSLPTGHIKISPDNVLGYWDAPEAAIPSDVEDFGNWLHEQMNQMVFEAIAIEVPNSLLNFHCEDLRSSATALWHMLFPKEDSNREAFFRFMACCLASRVEGVNWTEYGALRLGQRTIRLLSEAIVFSVALLAALGSEHIKLGESHGDDVGLMKLGREVTVRMIACNFISSGRDVVRRVGAGTCLKNLVSTEGGAGILLLPTVNRSPGQIYDILRSSRSYASAEVDTMRFGEGRVPPLIMSRDGDVEDAISEDRFGSLRSYVGEVIRDFKQRLHDADQLAIQQVLENIGIKEEKQNGI